MYRFPSAVLLTVFASVITLEPPLLDPDPEPLFPLDVEALELGVEDYVGV